MKRYISFLLIAIVLLLGCGDTNSLHVLHDINTIVSEHSEVTDLTPEAWEKIRIVRELDLESTEEYRNKYLGTESYTTESEEYYQKLLVYIAEGKKLQEAFYNRYIDADGIAIVGNDRTLDGFFVCARQLILIMTAKRPELRNLFRHSYYIILVGGSDPPEPRIGYSGETNLCFTSGGSPSRYEIPELIRLEIEFGVDPDTGTPITTVSRKYTHILGDGSLMSLTNSSAPPVDNFYVKSGYCWGKVITSVDKNRCASMSTILHEFVHAIIPVMKRYDPTFEDKWDRAYDNAVENKLWAFSYYTPRKRDIHHFMTYVLDVFYFEIGGKIETPIGSRYNFKTVEDFIAYDPITAEIILEWFAYAPMQELFSTDMVMSYSTN